MRAVSFCLSTAEKPAASTIAPSACRRSPVLLPSTCANDAGFFDISRSRMPAARLMLSMTSSNSASFAKKSLVSLVRTSVAAFKSAVASARLAPSSSIFVSATLIALVSSSIFASSFSFCFFAESTSKFPFFAMSSHQLTNSWYAFASSSPSFVILAVRSPIISNTLANGFVPAAAANVARGALPRKSSVAKPHVAFIAADATADGQWTATP
mmetsp:Transcript_100175/g.311567  ORF Transcript_100175/g.311567 Transcript_100175/m.311567 type:complete len:212 (+) Transcript_100175:1581-2216(+)